MKSWLIGGIAAIVLLGLGGYTIHRYGKAQYNAGRSDATSELLQANAKLDKSNALELERIQDEVQKLNTNQYIDELRNLGILRDYSDR